MGRSREHWVDAAKGLAILLVAASHGLQGLWWPKSALGNALGCVFNESVYCFHFQLFFLCSGYLWQRYGKQHGWPGHFRAILRKAWLLGVPYVVFTTLSWSLKTLCARAVNHPTGSLGHVLFESPAAPYWFLPALLLLFALLPRMSGERGWAVAFAAAVAIKTISVVHGSVDWCFPVRTAASNAFWFASGMGLALWGMDFLQSPSWRWIGAACALLFLAGAVAANAAGLWWHPRRWSCGSAKWGLGVLACTAVISWAVRREAPRSPSPGVWEWLGRNSLPVFLMHTLFAAAVRVALAALGVRSLWIHVPAMLAASIAGPLAAMRILERVHLDGLVDPRRWQTRRRMSGAARIGLSDGVGRR